MTLAAVALAATLHTLAPPAHLREGRVVYTVEEAAPTPAAVQALCNRRIREMHPGSTARAGVDDHACALTRKGEPAVIILPALRSECPALYYAMLEHEIAHAVAAEIGEDASRHINWLPAILPFCPIYPPPPPPPTPED